MDEENYDSSVVDRTESRITDDALSQLTNSGTHTMSNSNKIMDAGPMIAAVEGAVAASIGGSEYLGDQMVLTEPEWSEDQENDDNNFVLTPASDADEDCSLDTKVQNMENFASFRHNRVQSVQPLVPSLASNIENDENRFVFNSSLFFFMINNIET